MLTLGRCEARFGLQEGHSLAAVDEIACTRDQAIGGVGYEYRGHGPTGAYLHR